MEGVNDDAIRAFMSVSYGYGSGSGSGSGDGSGYGDGSGSGSGSGDGSGYGDGWGSGDGSGYGDGWGSGWGSGDGDGWGSGSGDGSGYGSGSGSVSGSGSGYGSGWGYGYGIRSFCGEAVYQVDGVSTIFRRIVGNAAKGAILNGDFTLTPTVVVRDGVNFAHGRTIREAEAALADKRLAQLDPEERIEEFVKAFPDVNAKVRHADLFAWHSRLTGSCEAGRLAFCKAHGLDPRRGKMTVRTFILLTMDAYGGQIIRYLGRKYGIKAE